VATCFILALFFSLWVIGKTLFPIPLEVAATGAGPINLDFWYHSALTQMLKTYGVPSTGFDGTPWIYYHYGTHWMIAQLSKLLALPVIQLYAAGYSILFVPWYFQAYLVFALTVRRLVFGKPEGNALPGFLFWTVLLCVFIQVIKHQYSGGLLGSFLVSHVLLLRALSALLAGAQELAPALPAFFPLDRTTHACSCFRVHENLGSLQYTLPARVPFSAPATVPPMAVLGKSLAAWRCVFMGVPTSG
jgi:hypothetical protein